LEWWTPPISVCRVHRNLLSRHPAYMQYGPQASFNRSGL